MKIISCLKSLLKNLIGSNKNKVSQLNELKLSHNKLERFFKCRRCFYLQYRLGMKLPTLGGSFALSNAVDHLLKREFDQYRTKQEPHPVCVKYSISAIPFDHSEFSSWRKNLSYLIPNTNITIGGKLDDVWINKRNQELIVVDYKSTSKKDGIDLNMEIPSHWKRQVEIYQWILRKNGFSVSDTAYFVYCNAKKSLNRFDKKLLFDIAPLSYKGDDSWVEKIIEDAYECLKSNQIPEVSEGCDYCKYWEGVRKCIEKIL